MKLKKILLICPTRAKEKSQRKKYYFINKNLEDLEIFIYLKN